MDVSGCYLVEPIGAKVNRLAILAALGLSACTPSLDDQQDKLGRFVAKNRYGSSPDYYLVRLSGIAGPERVALMYAMTDDLEFCSEIAGFYMEKYPESRYTCEKGN